MKFTVLISSIVGIALAAPLPQYNEPWAGYFSPELIYPPYLANPYYTQSGSKLAQLPALPPPLTGPAAPYELAYKDHGTPFTPPLPPPALGPLDAPIERRPPAPTQPHQTPQIPKLKPPKLVSEKHRDRKPLTEKLSAGFEEAPAPSPARVEPVVKPVVKERDPKGDFDKDAIRYHVNVGGVQKGGDGRTTNFHVFTDENGNKHFSDKLDGKTEKYITENMIPRLGGKRRGTAPGGGVWSVFGDK